MCTWTELNTPPKQHILNIEINSIVCFKKCLYVSTNKMNIRAKNHIKGMKCKKKESQEEKYRGRKRERGRASGKHIALEGHPTRVYHKVASLLKIYFSAIK